MRRARGPELVESEWSEIQALVDELNQLGKAVLVEGRTDAEALRSAGVKCEVLTLSEFDEQVVRGELSEVVVLTDLDREGEAHLRRLTRRHGGSVKLLTGQRERLRRTLRYRRGMRSVSELFRPPRS
ncbi:MAG: hypothetical protein ABDH63_01055 [Candidatus Caldarchaeales archaeon]